MAEKAAKKKSTRKAGPRLSVKLISESGKGLAFRTVFNFRDKNYSSQALQYPEGYGKGKPKMRGMTTIFPADTPEASFKEAQAKVQELTSQALDAGWVRVAKGGTDTFAEIPAAE